MTVCQLQSTGIINYSEAGNNNIICPNNLMFSNIAKCGNRNVRPMDNKNSFETACIWKG